MHAVSTHRYGFIDEHKETELKAALLEMKKTHGALCPAG
jgi:hypothetical protein